MIEIYDVFTTRGAGVRTQIFSSGGHMGLHMRFRTSGFPPSTLVRAFFVAEYIEQVLHPALGAFRPWYIVSGDLVIDDGDYQAGLEWDLPDSDPLPSPDADAARRLADETWRMRNWAGTWEFKALASVLTAGVGEGQIAVSQQRWVYNISYS